MQSIYDISKQRFHPVRALLKTSKIAAIIIGLSACGQEPAQMPRNTGPVEVVAYTVESKEVPVFAELTGRISAVVTAEIRPQTGGIIRKLLFTEGSQVKAGQVLYEIDHTSAQTTVTDAEATLASAKVAATSAKATNTRYRELLKIDAVSQESAEEAEATYKQAVLTVTSAEANLKSAKNSLSYADVTSPIDGHIGRSNVSEGALVTAGQTTALVTVQQLDTVYLDATQSANEYLRIRKKLQQGDIKLENGEPIVQLVKDDGTLYEMAGKLALNDANVDETTGTVTIRAKFPNPKKHLIPGMYGKIRLEGAVLQNALVVPQVAIRRDVKGNALAYVIDENNTIQERKLTTGQTTQGDQWIVESGLKTGDRVVVEGLQKVQVGSVVSIAQATDEAPTSAQTSNASSPSTVD